jgi:phage FluMu protein Com
MKFWFKKLKPCKCCGGKEKLYKKTIFSDYLEKPCPACLQGFTKDVDGLIFKELRNGWKRKGCKYSCRGLFGEFVEIIPLKEV